MGPRGKRIVRHAEEIASDADKDAEVFATLSTTAPAPPPTGASKTAEATPGGENGAPAHPDAEGSDFSALVAAADLAEAENAETIDVRQAEFAAPTGKIGAPKSALALSEEEIAPQETVSATPVAHTPPTAQVATATPAAGTSRTHVETDNAQPAAPSQIRPDLVKMSPEAAKVGFTGEGAAPSAAPVADTEVEGPVPHAPTVAAKTGKGSQSTASEIAPANAERAPTLAIRASSAARQSAANIAKPSPAAPLIGHLEQSGPAPEPFAATTREPPPIAEPAKASPRAAATVDRSNPAAAATADAPLKPQESVRLAPSGENSAAPLDPGGRATAGNSMELRAAVSPTGAREAPQPAIQLAQAIVRSAGANVDIRLDPPELGRVTMSLHMGDDRVIALIAADRGETLDLLRRNGDDLQRALRENGFEDVSLDFAERERDADDPKNQSLAGRSDESAETAQTPRAVNVRTATGVDIRI